MFALIITFLGSSLSIIAALYYIHKIVIGEVKPNRITWLLWGISPLIGAFASLKAGAGWATLPVFAGSVGPLMIFLVAMFDKKAYWKIRSFDYFCAAFALVALLVYLFSKASNIAIIFSLLADGAAALPTFKKAWQYPETENYFAFALAIVSSATSFLVAKHWNFTSLDLPVYLMLMNALLAILVFSRQRLKKKSF